MSDPCRGADREGRPVVATHELAAVLVIANGLRAPDRPRTPAAPAPRRAAGALRRPEPA